MKKLTEFAVLQRYEGIEAILREILNAIEDGKTYIIAPNDVTACQISDALEVPEQLNEIG